MLQEKDPETIQLLKKDQKESRQREEGGII